MSRDLQKWVAESRRAQGLPLRVKDPTILGAVAGLLIPNATTEPTLAGSATTNATNSKGQHHHADRST
ncbi:MAG: hypothetical protein M3P01_00890 [Actinomycetota bacterium]|nr:hypothetical protein [Actinomycetota bacterium]